MEKRMNGTHEIIQSLKISNSEIVLGYDPRNTLTPYVTWEYNAENDSYFWGHYFKDEYSAQKDLVSRGNDKIIHYDNIKSNEDRNKGEEEKHQSSEKTLCALYETEGQEHAIMQYPNGLFYNHYGYNSQTNISDTVAGDYSSFEEAEKMMYKHRKYAFKTYMADIPIRTPAETLPSGWQWVKYNDGSGHLQSPNGQEYFSYDWTTGEYKITPEISYDFFVVENYESGGYSIGGFDKFQEYAEKYINDNVLSKEKSIREVLESKRDKRDTGFETENAARIQENALFNMDRGIK